MFKPLMSSLDSWAVLDFPLYQMVGYMVVRWAYLIHIIFIICNVKNARTILRKLLHKNDWGD
jgi:hypothetical protein